VREGCRAGAQRAKAGDSDGPTQTFALRALRLGKASRARRLPRRSPKGEGGRLGRPDPDVRPTGASARQASRARRLPRRSPKREGGRLGRPDPDVRPTGASARQASRARRLPRRSPKREGGRRGRPKSSDRRSA